jgi:hypothetical protein
MSKGRSKVKDYSYGYLWIPLHYTYIPLTLYPQSGSRGISDKLSSKTPMFYQNDLNTYHSCFIPVGVTEDISHILPKRGIFYQNYLAIRNIADITGGKPFAGGSPSISGVIAVLVAFYNIHGG